MYLHDGIPAIATVTEGSGEPAVHKRTETWTMDWVGAFFTYLNSGSLKVLARQYHVCESEKKSA